jgi:hypothetical protein
MARMGIAHGPILRQVMVYDHPVSRDYGAVRVVSVA